MRAVLVMSGVLAIGAPARALPEFPKALQKASDAPCLPHCNVCHRDDNAGSGTVDRPFGLSMEQVGGLDGQVESVARAVQVLQQRGTDSDGDGVPDIEELAMGDDPNDAHPTSLCGPEAGCSAPRASLGEWPFLLGVALLVRRVRRRERSGTTSTKERKSCG